MRKKILGVLLIIISAGIIAVAVSIFREPNSGILHALGPLFLATILFLQGIAYLSNAEPKLAISEISITLPDSGIHFDPTLRANLVEKLKQMNGPKIVTFREFFNGNFSDQGAIGPNLWPEHPGILTFVSCFENLMKRSDVEAIYVEVTEVEPDSECWPYSDRVYIFGDISEEALLNESKKLRPTEIGDRKDAFSPIKESVRSLSKKPLNVLWWD